MLVVFGTKNQLVVTLAGPPVTPFPNLKFFPSFFQGWAETRFRQEGFFTLRFMAQYLAPQPDPGSTFTPTASAEGPKLQSNEFVACNISVI